MPRDTNVAGYIKFTVSGSCSNTDISIVGDYKCGGVANNGIGLSSSTFQLGGNLVKNTSIGVSSSSLRFTSGTGTTEALFIGSNGRIGINNTLPSGLFQVGNGATNSLTVTNTGYVGIGTTNPNVKLAVMSRSDIAAVGTAAFGNGDGTFTVGTGWTAGSWTISAGSASHAAGSTAPMYATFDATQTTVVYQIGFTVLGYTTGSFSVSLGATMPVGITGKNAGVDIQGAQSYYLFVRPQTATGIVAFIPSIDYVGSIDNVSIRPITSLSSTLSILNSDNTIGIEMRAGGIGASGNTFIGQDAGKNSTTGGKNAALGNFALANNTWGRNNSAVGAYTLYNNTIGVQNVAMGDYALYNNISGDYNVATGTNTLYFNTSGWYNTANGAYSLYNNTTGYRNTALGNNTLFNNKTGSNNTAFGINTLYNNISGDNNSAFGNSALYNNLTGSNNVAVGNEALNTGTSLNYNVAIGYRAGRMLSVGSSNIFIGNAVGGSGSYSNALYIGNSSVPAIYGNLLTNNIGLGTTNTTESLQIYRPSNNAFVLQSDTSSFRFVNYSGQNFIQSGAALSSDSKADIRFTSMNGVTDWMMIKASNGNIGMGTVNPGYRLHVLNTSTSGVAMFMNMQTGWTVPTIAIGTSSVATGTTGAEFIKFLAANGAKAGRIRTGNTVGSLIYATTGTGDLAEYVIADQPTEAGDLISFSDDKFTLSTSDKPLAGIHSSYATFVGNEQNADKPNSFPLAIAGIVKLKVSSVNGPIKKGDALAQSHISGVAAKAIKSGYIAARALNDYSNADPNSVGMIEVIAGLNWYDPNIVITQDGQINTNTNISPEVLASLGYEGTKNEIEAATYSITDAAGNAVSTIGQFAQASIAKLNAGLISAQNIIAQNIVVKNLISQNIKTDTISPLGNKLTINGNLEVGKTLTAPTAQINELKADVATISTLYADSIISREGNFGDVLTSKVTSLRDEMKKMIASTFATASAGTSQTAIASEVDSWTFDPDAKSIKITGNLTLTDNLVIGSKLTVNGQTELASAFVTGHFQAGEVAIKNNMIETSNAVLLVQPSGTGTINMLNGLFIAQSGEVQINGNLKVNGKFTAQEATVSGSLVANMIKADSAEFNKLAANELKIATDSAAGLVVADSLTNPIATTSAQTTSNATAGMTTLPAGITELTVHSTKIGANSMVYLTPNSSTNNQVPYVKSRTGESFTIAIDQPLSSDVSLNWWIIN